MVQRYPYVATEVLCSEIWSIVETCVNHSEELLAPFWETVLDRPPEDMKMEMVMASHFAKINAVFLTKKPAEVGSDLRFSSYVFTHSIVDACVYPIPTIRRGAITSPRRGSFNSGFACSHYSAGRASRRSRCSRSMLSHALVCAVTHLPSPPSGYLQNNSWRG